MLSQAYTFSPLQVKDASQPYLAVNGETPRRKLIHRQPNLIVAVSSLARKARPHGTKCMGGVRPE